MTPVIHHSLVSVWPVLLLTFGLTWLVGAIPVLRQWHENHLHHFVSFSAGVLIATAFLHILPEAADHSSPRSLGMGIISGFLFLFILEKFIMIHPCEETHCNYHTLGLSAFFGIGLHSMFDGVAMGSSFLVPSLVQPVFFAIIIHKMPSAFALTSLLKSAHWRTGRIFSLLTAFSLIIPITSIVTFTLFLRMPNTMGGHAMNFALGSFLYIATSDFLPEIHRRGDQKTKNFIAFLIGVVVMGALAFKPHHSS